MKKDHLKMQREFQKFIIGKLPKGYLWSTDDLFWLFYVASYWNYQFDNKSIIEAVDSALEAGEKNTDPYELFIDAGICDVKEKPIL